MARSIESMNNEFINLVAEAEAAVGTDRNTLFAQAEERLAGQILIRSHEAQAHASRLRNLIDEEITTTQARILARAFDAMTVQLHETTVSKEELLREVQERKRVQEDLGREREWLRVTLSSIGDAVIATEGSRFVLTIPFLQAQTTRLEAPEAAPLAGRSQAQTHLSDKGPRIRALIADDQALFRDGVARLVDKEADIRCVGQAANGREAIELARNLNPDVILMDINMPEVSGLEATLAIHRDLPEIRIIGLSMHDDPELAQAMYAAGAVGYKSKSCAAAELVAAIRNAMTSGRMAEHGYSGRVRQRQRVRVRVRDKGGHCPPFKAAG